MSRVTHGGRHFSVQLPEHRHDCWWVWEVDRHGAILDTPAGALVAMAASRAEARLAIRLHVGGADRSTIDRACRQLRLRRSWRRQRPRPQRR